MTDISAVDASPNVQPFGPEYVELVKQRKVTVPTTTERAVHLSELLSILHQVKQLGQVFV